MSPTLPLILASERTAEADLAVYACSLKHMGILNDALAAPKEAWDAWCPKGVTALVAAIRARWAEGVAALLDAGADPARLCKSGESALSAALANKDLPTAQRLVSAGADLQAGIGAPLALACAEVADRFVPNAQDWVSFCLDLIRQGAHPDSLTASGIPALVIATKPGMEGIAMALVEAGANVNATEPAEGKTALHFLCDTRVGKEETNAQFGLALFLQENGADLQAKSRLGLYPAYLSRWNESAAGSRAIQMKAERDELLELARAARPAPEGSAETPGVSGPALAPPISARKKTRL